MRNGILSAEDSKEKPVVITCLRCVLVNQHENKYCPKCSYPLTPQAYDEVKISDNIKYHELEKRYERDLNALREDMENKFQVLLSKIELSKLV